MKRKITDEPCRIAPASQTVDRYIADLDYRFTDLQEPIESFVEDRFHTVDGSFDSRLSHIDYQYTNVLVDPDTCETTAVLDWGHVTAVDPYYDLVVAEHHLCKRAPLYSPDRNRVRGALEAGYEETNSIERDEEFNDVVSCICWSHISRRCFGFRRGSRTLPRRNGRIWKPNTGRS